MATSTLAPQSATVEIDPAVSTPQVIESPASDLCLSEILATSEAAGNRIEGTATIHGVMVGRFVAATESGEPLVDYACNPGTQPRRALSTVAVSQSDLGQQVVLMFEQGDPQRPIILGVLVASPAIAVANAVEESSDLYKVRADQERLVLKADREIVLQCGQASITLTSAGKVLLRGAYVSSRSSGVNRVKGASVQIN